MLELLFMIGFFITLIVTGVSLLGVLATLVVTTAVMFLDGLFALMIELLPWLLLAVAVVWVIKAIKAPKVPWYRRNSRRFYQGIERYIITYNITFGTKQELIIKPVTIARLMNSSSCALHTAEPKEERASYGKPQFSLPPPS